MKRDLYRELLVSSFISILFLYVYPNPPFCPLLNTFPWKWNIAETDVIHIGVIMKGVGSGKEKSLNLLRQFVTLYRSILENTKRRRHLHFVFLTDVQSAPFLDRLLKRFSNQDLKSTYRVDVTYQFVDTKIISDRYIGTINQLRPYFATPVSSQTTKYKDELFLLGLFYHRIFPYENIIMLDADLRFEIDVSELYEQFENFDKVQVMAVAKDMTPHYRFAFEKYRSTNPNTLVGEPGILQGLNTGVVLYHLENMRKSRLYNFYVNPENGSQNTNALAEKYQFKSQFGDQCVFTLLNMEHPKLFYPLPCGFNFQLDTRGATQRLYMSLFFDYHNCTDTPKIYHASGGSEFPTN